MENTVVHNTSWGRQPAPDPALIEIAEKFLEAVKNGQVRSALVITVNQLHEHELAAGGILDGVYRTVLIGGLSEAAFDLSHRP